MTISLVTFATGLSVVTLSLHHRLLLMMMITIAKMIKIISLHHRLLPLVNLM